MEFKSVSVICAFESRVIDWQWMGGAAFIELLVASIWNRALIWGHEGDENRICWGWPNGGEYGAPPY